MDINVIPIGNSRGIRLSKTLLDKYQISDEVEIVLKPDYFIVKPKQRPRANWDKAFKKMRANGDDKLLIPDVFKDEKFDK